MVKSPAFISKTSLKEKKNDSSTYLNSRWDIKNVIYRRDLKTS